MINYIVDYGRQSDYLIYRIPEGTTRREMFAKLPVDMPSYMHSFAVTDHYVILVEYPLVVSPFALMKGRGFIQNYHWNSELGTYFRVIRRDNGVEVGRYKYEAFFAFHHVNAFEKDSTIVLDVVTYPNADIILDIGKYAEPQSRINGDAHGIKLQRFTLALSEGVVTVDTIANEPMEFPRINDSRDGKTYQYAYLVDFRDPQSDDDIRCIYKVDVNAKGCISWSEKGSYPGEPIFVPCPNASKEMMV